MWEIATEVRAFSKYPRSPISSGKKVVILNRVQANDIISGLVPASQV